MARNKASGDTPPVKAGLAALAGGVALGRHVRANMGRWVMGVVKRVPVVAALGAAVAYVKYAHDRRHIYVVDEGAEALARIMLQISRGEAQRQAPRELRPDDEVEYPTDAFLAPEELPGNEAMPGVNEVLPVVGPAGGVEAVVVQQQPDVPARAARRRFIARTYGYGPKVWEVISDYVTREVGRLLDNENNRLVVRRLCLNRMKDIGMIPSDVTRALPMCIAYYFIPTDQDLSTHLVDATVMVRRRKRQLEEAAYSQKEAGFFSYLKNMCRFKHEPVPIVP